MTEKSLKNTKVRGLYKAVQQNNIKLELHF